MILESKDTCATWCLLRCDDRDSFPPSIWKVPISSNWPSRSMSVAYQKGYEDRKLVDVVDLDGDGTAEVIGEGFEIENNLYVIYKRQAGTWRPVYQGGGGGAG